jgi:hypothetical protein
VSASIQGARDEKKQEQQPSGAERDLTGEIGFTAETKVDYVAEKDSARNHVGCAQRIIVPGQGDRSENEHIEDSRDAHRV